jgi:serine/threonine-protein kinase
MTAPSSPPSQIGRFQIRGELGRGGMGVVYHAHDPQLGRDVALKVPHPDLLNRPDLVARFDREVKAAARLQHPHIVPVYEAGQDGPYHFLVSAFIRGESLEKACQRGPLPPKLAARVVRELALALDYAHRGGVVHRDVKCSNALLDEKKRAYLMDFGLAFVQDASRLTREGACMGTYAYMAPEQFDGRAEAASDQYSLGVVLYEVLTGRRPFEGPPLALLHQIQTQEPAPPSSLRPGLDPRLDAICRRAMARQPGQRFANCHELADELGRWLRDALARPVPAPAGPGPSAVSSTAPTRTYTPPTPAAAGPVGTGAPPPAAPVSPTPLPAWPPQVPGDPPAPVVAASPVVNVNVSQVVGQSGPTIAQQERHQAFLERARGENEARGEWVRFWNRVWLVGIVVAGIVLLISMFACARWLTGLMRR